MCNNAWRIQICGHLLFLGLSCTQEENGTLKFLLSRQDLASVHSCASSDSSSIHYNPSPTGISPSTGGPIYDEIMAPSGYQIGTHKSIFLTKRADESFGMNVAGGAGGTVGDLPIFISAIKPDSVVGCCGKIQVRKLRKINFQFPVKNLRVETNRHSYTSYDNDIVHCMYTVMHIDIHCMVVCIYREEMFYCRSMTRHWLERRTERPSRA